MCILVIGDFCSLIFHSPCAQELVPSLPLDSTTTLTQPGQYHPSFTGAATLRSLLLKFLSLFQATWTTLLSTAQPFPSPCPGDAAMAGECSGIGRDLIVLVPLCGRTGWDQRYQGMPACAKTKKVIQNMSEGSSPSGQKERLGEMGSCPKLVPWAGYFKTEWIISWIDFWSICLLKQQSLCSPSVGSSVTSVLQCFLPSFLWVNFFHSCVGFEPDLLL